MSFNHVGRFWLANGAATWVFYRSTPHGVGVDRGAQWIMGNPLPYDVSPMPDGITQLETTRHQKRFVRANGGSEWMYIALVENTRAPGWHSTWFTLHGGGNT